MEGGNTGSKHSVTLNNGVSMPLLGLGTFRLRGQENLIRAVDAALACGYRSFDTASVYRNEGDLGCALQQLLPKYGLTRSDIFITSKLSPADLGEGTREACLRSISELGCEYLDLYLIHWPGKQGWRSDDARNVDARAVSWRAMEDLYEAGLIKAIGVSNYTDKHLTADVFLPCSTCCAASGIPPTSSTKGTPGLVQEKWGSPPGLFLFGLWGVAW
ncbi:uncharacterized protein LOC100216027 [Xenopus tropicalis]|uniref:Uncharacterized protein LOC100216027 n=1 Tax=Xenopus tropicalis TaxID=8364 RepID=B4F6H9_XENTR|nr:uncharacterized protein LOC100216027 [Xenopus tropicalis]AAI67885.1 Unknown (protein for MGC:135304) [Xenopus tropicalis]|eukprot:NP_001135489.1 uncharacterized protein LOC100216027 [Xenopus tropicalis]